MPSGISLTPILPLPVLSPPSEVQGPVNSAVEAVSGRGGCAYRQLSLASNLPQDWWLVKGFLVLTASGYSGGLPHSPCGGVLAMVYKLCLESY